MVSVSLCFSCDIGVVFRGVRVGVVAFALFLGFAAYLATRSWTVLFLSHLLYDLVGKPMYPTIFGVLSLAWLVLLTIYLIRHFGKGSASRPASPPAPPISADCRVDGMPAVE